MKWKPTRCWLFRPGVSKPRPAEVFWLACGWSPFFQWSLAHGPLPAGLLLPVPKISTHVKKQRRYADQPSKRRYQKKRDKTADSLGIVITSIIILSPVLYPCNYVCSNSFALPCILGLLFGALCRIYCVLSGPVLLFSLVFCPFGTRQSCDVFWFMPGKFSRSQLLCNDVIS